MLQLNVPQLDHSKICDNEFDTQATTYVGGYLVKKFLKSLHLDCAVCNQYLKSSEIQQHHTFNMFEECDETQRLCYVTKDLKMYLNEIHDLII